MGWRRDWAQKVRTAITPEPVAHCILELESFLRAAALSPIWGSQAQPCPAGVPPRKASAGRKAASKPAKAPVTISASKSGRLNRAASTASGAAPSTSKRRNYKEDSDSGLSESDEEDHQEVYSIDDDPTIVDNPGQSNKSYWVLNQRDKWSGHFKGGTRLPQDAAKHLGRRGGTIRLPGVKYNSKNLVLQPRLAWRGAMQGAHTASELALQLRKLDSYIQWEALKRPALDADSPLANAEVLQRRPADVPKKGWDYLVQMAPAETSTVTGLGPNSGVRQPLQPLMAVPGTQQAHQQQQHQQLMSKQVLLQLPGEPLAPLQQLQEAEERQQQSAQMPNQTLSVLPNHVAVQQHQQAFGAEEDKQIAVQLAVSTLSDAELPRQLPAIAESASRPAESAVPDQAQAATSVPNGLPPAASAGLHDTDGVVRVGASRINGASQPSQLDIVPAQPPTAAQLPGTELGPEASPGDFNQQLHGDQTDAKLSQQTEALIKPEATAAACSSPQSDPHPTPAPTPFLTQQPHKQASLLQSLVPNQQHRPSLAASSAQATGQSGRAQGQDLGAGPSREGTPAPKGPATWLRESQLPLWLVKMFEEKRRRDVAMVAARAAQQAQRDANAASRGLVHLSHPWLSSGTLTASGLKTKRQEAKAAADAAAAAAADACAICDKVYGEDTEKDESWIACDRCNRWYHGTCVGMTQEMVDENQDKKWECPECSSMRAERRSLAAQRARLKRSSQGKAIGSAASGPDAGLDDQPATSKRDGKKSRRPKAAPKSGKKRKTMEGGEAVDEAEEAGVEAVELFCLCRQPDDGREFIECDSCNQWYHCECVGVNLQDMSEGDKYTCPLCVRALQQQERREQRKAEAAAAAEIEREAKEAQAARKAKLAALDMSGWPRNWQAAVVRVLETVTKLPEALPFAEPVPMEEVPGYREQIPNPMDLGTILGRAKADAYDTPLEILDDVRQVWQNCRIFNAEGSAIWEVCEQAEDSFESNWSSARLPLTPRPPLPPSLALKKQAKSGSKRQRDAGNPSSSAPSTSGTAATADPGSGSGATGSKPRLIVKLSKRQQQPEEEEEPSSSEAEISDSDDEAGQKPRVKLKIKGRSSKQSAGAHESAADLSRAQKVVRGVLKLKTAAPFSRPVNEEEVPGYGLAVQNAMDLGTVLEKLKNGEYTSLGEVLGDVDLIWSNCRSFNEADSDICDLADQAQQALRMRWQQEGLPTVTPLAPSARKKQKKDGKKASLEAGASASDAERQSGPKRKKSRTEAAAVADISSAADLSSAQKAVKGTLKLKVAAPFSAPVDEEDVPGYSSVILNPMDLGSIAEKLKNGEYATTGAVYQDVQLVWDNCRSFNKPDSDICKTCDEAQQAFLAKWLQQGLPLPAADKKKKRQSGSAEAEAAAAGKGMKKPDSKVDRVAKQREASASDKRKSDAQEMAVAGKPSVKRKRGQGSAADEEEEPSSSAAAQPKKKSKGALVKVELAPEKMSASARLRKGLPPTPPSRISPRMATAETTSAAPTTAESAPDEASKANAKDKAKSAVIHQGVNKVKADADPPVARRSSGRLK